MAKKKPKPAGPRETARLRGFDAKGKLVEEEILSLHDYYDGSPRLIDDDDFLAKRRITKVTGHLYDPKGALFQEFEVRYTAKFKFAGSTVRHADGTVNETKPT